jgi:hypothetical protein
MAEFPSFTVRWGAFAQSARSGQRAVDRTLGIDFPRGSVVMLSDFPYPEGQPQPDTVSDTRRRSRYQDALTHRGRREAAAAQDGQRCLARNAGATLVHFRRCYVVASLAAPVAGSQTVERCCWLSLVPKLFLGSVIRPYS